MKRAVASPQLATWWAPSRPRGEGEDVAWLELAPVAVGAHAGRPISTSEQLFLGEVVVVGVRRLAGRDLPDACAEPLGLELPADARALRPEARMDALLVELRLEDVGHGTGFATPVRDPPPRR